MIVSGRFNQVIRGAPVYAEHGAKGAELEPAGKQLRVHGIAWPAGEEAAGIGIPIWDAAHAEVEPGRDLLCKDFPCPLDITGPCYRRVGLLAGVRGAGEDED